MTDDARAPYTAGDPALDPELERAFKDREAAARLQSLTSARGRVATLHLPEVALSAPGHVISEYRQWCERKVAAWTELVAAQELLAPMAEQLAVREAEVAGTITGSNAEQRKAALLIALADDPASQRLRQRQLGLQAVARKAEADLSIAREWCRWGYATLLCLAGTVAVESAP